MISRNVCVAILGGLLAVAGWSQELAGNGGFDSPLSAAVPGADGSVNTGGSWIFYLNSGATGNASADAGALKIVPEAIQAPAYGIQLIQSPVALEKGGAYQLSFDARSTGPRPVTIKVGGTGGRAWTAYSGEQKVTLTDSLARYTVKFTMGKPDDAAARIEFWFTESPLPVWIDNVSFAKLSQAEVAAAPVSGTTSKEYEDGITRWSLLWSDEFNAPKIDPTKWTFEKGNNNGWGNNELEVYTDKAANASVQKVDGTSSLVITARKESVKDNGRTFDYTSARMVTKNKFAMHEGKLEIRAKLPKGQGIWPALWLLGANIDTVPWPACGEIDLVELLGHDPSTFYSTIHGPVSGGPGVGKSFTLPPGQSFSDSFHVFTLEWRPEHLEFLVDGHLFFVAPKNKVQYEQGEADWVYDHPYFLIMNVAVGGNWPGNPNSTTVFPQSMAVDYVRVYQNMGSELEPGELEWVP